MTSFRLYFQQVLIMVYYICTRTNMFFLWRANCFRYLMLSLIYGNNEFFLISNGISLKTLTKCLGRAVVKSDD